MKTDLNNNNNNIKYLFYDKIVSETRCVLFLFKLMTTTCGLDYYYLHFTMKKLNLRKKHVKDLITNSMNTFWYIM